MPAASAPSRQSKNAASATRSTYAHECHCHGVYCEQLMWVSQTDQGAQRSNCYSWRTRACTRPRLHTSCDTCTAHERMPHTCMSHVQHTRASDTWRTFVMCKHTPRACAPYSARCCKLPREAKDCSTARSGHKEQEQWIQNMPATITTIM